jgi:thiosulfate/3-mercaptopyruvate sulfurtransferase
MKKLAIGLTLMLGVGTAGAATPLVDVGWIKAHSCDADVRVLDVRNRIDGGSKATYLEGHIPCAVYSNYIKDGWRSKVDDVPGQLSPVDKLEALIGKLGIDNQTHVVIYSAGTKAADMGSATRVYWTFKLLGHDEVSILDGGWKAYKGNPKKPANKIESGNNLPSAKKFTAAPRMQMRATKAEVTDLLGKNVALIDLRPTHQYVGVNKHGKAKRAGTIPGAMSLPESWVTENGGGRFRQAATLSELYQVASVPTSGEQVYFCNSGHWASLGWFVSSELLGNKGAKLYDGSMIEWSADMALPMEQKVKVKKL